MDVKRLTARLRIIWLAGSQCCGCIRRENAAEALVRPCKNKNCTSFDRAEMNCSRGLVPDWYVAASGQLDVSSHRTVRGSPLGQGRPVRRAEREGRKEVKGSRTGSQIPSRPAMACSLQVADQMGSTTCYEMRCQECQSVCSCQDLLLSFLRAGRATGQTSPLVIAPPSRIIYAVEIACRLNFLGLSSFFPLLFSTLY